MRQRMPTDGRRREGTCVIESENVTTSLLAPYASLDPAPHPRSVLPVFAAEGLVEFSLL
jgi:hypothetical protein